ncbi:FAD-dependent oxidoreductase [Veronia pacifica]|uniref:FAD dependent oxidoreductase domain-containing protein n=1 Tax=Veronia pacifica TaxID=1080227 RepID=A0A1C3EPB4_9GAMM|nr:FAD-dependent oxidoreductase [Veronia pacifica]ODA35052.1 hypothetical protein A8L45_05070 [Veronia pacifica]
MKYSDHATIIGGGVVGLTSAYEMLKQGFAVTLLEKEPDVALGASHANGAQLSYSFVDAMSSPLILRKLPVILAGKDPALTVKCQPSIMLTRWSAKFLFNGLAFRERKNSEHLYRLALFSSEKMEKLRRENNLEFNFRECGKLVVYRNKDDYERAKQGVERKAEWGFRQQILSVDECVKKEPALRNISSSLAGGLYSGIDHIGDAARFCQSLLAVLQDMKGFDIKFNCAVSRLVAVHGRVTHIVTHQGVFDTDKVIVAAGCGAQHILRSLAISLPIYPVNGYSLTFPANNFSPNCSVTDLANKVVIGKIGDRVRLAGFADIVSGSAQHTEGRLAELLALGRALFPDAADYDHILDRWQGSRPCTPTSLPIIDRVGYENLYVNAGHGMYGWTLAAGSARLLAARITDDDLWQQFGGLSRGYHAF